MKLPDVDVREKDRGLLWPGERLKGAAKGSEPTCERRAAMRGKLGCHGTTGDVDRGPSRRRSSAAPSGCASLLLLSICQGVPWSPRKSPLCRAELGLSIAKPVAAHSAPLKSAVIPCEMSGDGRSRGGEGDFRFLDKGGVGGLCASPPLILLMISCRSTESCPVLLVGIRGRLVKYGLKMTFCVEYSSLPSPPSSNPTGLPGD